ncbi:hypothetical protein GX441_07825 [bacterium]|nr:hypothetical protein [bacterium]
MKFIFASGMLFTAVTFLSSQDNLAITQEGKFCKELDIRALNLDATFIKLYSSTGEAYTYPWAGESSLNYRIDEKGLFVNGVQVGVNLQDPDSCSVEDADRITCAMVFPYNLNTLSRFPNLATLTFGCPIDDPELDLSILAKCKELKGIYFAAGSLSEGQIADISRCSGLRELDFSVTVIPEGSMKLIRNLPNLRALVIASVSDSELFALSGHKQLQSLTRYWEVCDTGWSDLLASLPNLVELTIIQAEIADEVFEYLSQSNKLERLSLPYSGVYGDDFSLISRMTNLKELDLTGTEINDEDVKPLTNLECLKSLSIGGGGPGHLTDTGIAYLSGLSTLQHLDISSTYVTDEGLEYIQSLVNLKILNLVSTGITDKGLVHIETLKNLRLLDLSGTTVTDEGIESVKKAVPGCEIVKQY